MSERLMPLPMGETQPESINAYLRRHNLSLGKIIGEGSYSKVRQCIASTPKNRLERFIACKIINKKKASYDFVNKFLPRELEIVGRLQHPHIVTVFDVVAFEHHVYIFMDFCKGDLLDHVKKEGFVYEGTAKLYFYQILTAVRYLHGLDLAHRDLKCENILLFDFNLVKLSDFGFSRYCHDESGKRILSSTYCGSAAYAAPEILQGTMYNPKLYDMWSLGCILFIMLTGHMPYDESDIQKMLQNQQDRILMYPHHVDSLISKAAKRLIRHLLEPDVIMRATIDQSLSNAWFGTDKSSGVVCDGVLGNVDDGSGSGDGNFELAEHGFSPPTSSRESTRGNVSTKDASIGNCSKSSNSTQSSPLNGSQEMEPHKGNDASWLPNRDESNATTRHSRYGSRFTKHFYSSRKWN